LHQVEIQLNHRGYTMEDERLVKPYWVKHSDVQSQAMLTTQSITDWP